MFSYVNAIILLTLATANAKYYKIFSVVSCRRPKNSPQSLFSLSSDISGSAGVIP